MMLLKVLFPSLECSKMLKFNVFCVSYEPLFKILSMNKVFLLYPKILFHNFIFYSVGRRGNQKALPLIYSFGGFGN